MSDRLDRGVVLVAVLFAVAIMSVMVVAASALTRSATPRSIARPGPTIPMRVIFASMSLSRGLQHF
jgi:hypothetical protein